jgi:hypothetical protein
MSVINKNIIPAKQAENSDTTQYTASNVTAIIDKFTITNTTSGAVSLSVHIVPSAGSVGDGNLVMDAKFVAAGETYTCPELVGQVLASGSFISTIASAATSLTIRASGREVS